MTLAKLSPQILRQAKEVCPTCDAKDIIKWGKRKTDLSESYLQQAVKRLSGVTLPMGGL